MPFCKHGIELYPASSLVSPPHADAVDRTSYCLTRSFENIGPAKAMDEIVRDLAAQVRTLLHETASDTMSCVALFFSVNALRETHLLEVI